MTLPLPDRANVQFPMTITAESLARAYRASGRFKFKEGDKVVSKYQGLPMTVLSVSDAGVWCLFEGWSHLTHCFLAEDLELLKHE